MVGLMDIAPARGVVTVAGQKVECCAISLDDVFVLFGRFPELQQMLMRQKLDASALFALGPAVVAAVLAAGTNRTGDKKAEAAARKLGLEAQVDLLNGIVDLTMPGGFGPFVDKLTRLAGTFNPDTTRPAAAPATSSQPQSSS